MKDDYDEEVCNTKLELAIGSNDFVYKKDKRDEHHHQIMKSKNKRVVTCLDLSLPLDNYKEDEDEDDGSSAKEIINNNNINGEEGGQISNSSCSIDVKEDNNKRKKLRLSIEQSCVLEECFKQHTTLNMAQKYALAEKLNLKPRQIEVWFQNRRARTKLKQTEVNCVLLKKCCENLKEENTRLKKELEEMRGLIIKRAAFCHSCKKIARSSPGPN